MKQACGIHPSHFGHRLKHAYLVLALIALDAKGSSFSEDLERYLAINTQSSLSKTSYSIGPIGPQALQPCVAFEHFQPVGKLLRGKTMVGVRCLAPTTWTIYVSVQIRIEGSYLMTTRQMVAGQIVTAQDVFLKSGDLGLMSPNVLTDPIQAIGHAVKMGIGVGQALRSEHIRTPYAVQQGQKVILRVTGAGFSASSSGLALSNAAAGGVVQVKTPSGAVVGGIAKPGGVVEVSL